MSARVPANGVPANGEMAASGKGLTLPMAGTPPRTRSRITAIRLRQAVLAATCLIAAACGGAPLGGGAGQGGSAGGEPTSAGGAPHPGERDPDRSATVTAAVAACANRSGWSLGDLRVEVDKNGLLIAISYRARRHDGTPPGDERPTVDRCLDTSGVTRTDPGAPPG